MYGRADSTISSLESESNNMQLLGFCGNMREEGRDCALGAWDQVDSEMGESSTIVVTFD